MRGLYLGLKRAFHRKVRSVVEARARCQMWL